jgi:hypothetical protein
MIRTTTVCLFLLAFSFMGADPADAQSADTPIRFVGVNVGAQPQRRTISTSVTSALYDETLRIDTAHRVANGALVGIAGGLQLAGSFGVGGEFSMFSSTGSAALNASIPHPLFHDRPALVNIGLSGLERKERTLHLSAMWMTQVTDKILVALSAGPSFINVSQQLVLSGSVADRTQNLTATPIEQSKTTVGVNAGFEGAYLFASSYGAALFVRYAGGSADLPDAADVKAGGFQVGLGARVYF